MPIGVVVAIVVLRENGTFRSLATRRRRLLVVISRMKKVVSWSAGLNKRETSEFLVNVRAHRSLFRTAGRRFINNLRLSAKLVLARRGRRGS